mmetsp:Transcript_47436/g.94678  ORF Transcript_47436/g.94678 Transcript_47436/m.94678 type:complete len:202 (-) Transcript_47436:123-728(-)
MGSRTALASTGWPGARKTDGAFLALLCRCGFGEALGDVHGELRGEEVGRSPRAERAMWPAWARRLSPEAASWGVTSGTTGLAAMGRAGGSRARARRIASRTFWCCVHVLQSGTEHVHACSCSELNMVRISAQPGYEQSLARQQMACSNSSMRFGRGTSTGSPLSSMTESKTRAPPICNRTRRQKVVRSLFASRRSWTMTSA